MRAIIRGLGSRVAGVSPTSGRALELTGHGGVTSMEMTYECGILVG